MLSDRLFYTEVRKFFKEPTINNNVKLNTILLHHKSVIGNVISKALIGRSLTAIGSSAKR